MNAHQTAIAFAAALNASTAPQLANAHLYAHDVELLPDGSQDAAVEEIRLPAVFVRVQFVALAGSQTIGKARVELEVRSQSDDETSATHSAREAAARAVFGDQAALVAAFGAGAAVELLGRPCLTDNNADVEQRAFQTVLTYLAGVREL